MEKINRIVLIGGPGTGKTTVIEALKELNYDVLPEVSREVTLKAQEEGIEQLFLEDPLAFSNRLLKGRIDQFNAIQSGTHFYDRGIPDVPAYHRFTGDHIPADYLQACNTYRYDQCFFFPAWKEIYKQDNERYEGFDQAIEIGEIIRNEYLNLGYDIIDVPLLRVEERIHFILNHI